MTNGYIIVHNVCSEFEVPEMEKGVASNWQDLAFLKLASSRLLNGFCSTWTQVSLQHPSPYFCVEHSQLITCSFCFIAAYVKASK